ncbi:RhoGAP-domain-containing protein [Athelia psychrophila]|uniref:RhoGAP-domain-containing protein n=1 Tax=Athelia psychrophila TaxID=1759441 RepID=A0A166GLV7_9AGAM|nr:RhoGAP-domain-containing protein [Fibularhizoctonia sp. CBS 109695]
MFRSTDRQKRSPGPQVPSASRSQHSLPSTSFSPSSSGHTLQHATHPSHSSQSHFVSPDSSAPFHLSTPSSTGKRHWPPPSGTSAPASTSSVGQMGQSLTRPEPPVPQAAHLALALGGSKGFKFRNAFGGRRKQSEEATLPTTPISSSSLNSRRGNGMERASSDTLDEGVGARRPAARQLTSQISTVFSARKATPTPPPSPSPYPTPAPPPRPIMAQPSGNYAPSRPSGDHRGIDLAERPSQEAGNQRRVWERAEQEKADVKELWRKSDSNMSFNTIRPELASVANRTSRPVSMADSLHSTHTIIPVNKRLSALITDVDFAMAEEDHGAAGTGTGPSPPGSFKSKKRRSSSLSFSSQFPRALVPAAYEEPAYGEPQAVGRSQSESPRLSPTPIITDSLVLNRAAASGYISPISSNSAVQSAGNNIQGRLAAWSATAPMMPVQPGRRIPAAPARDMRPPPNPYRQAPPPAPRQAALSISNSTGLAAGLAKRAVERMGRAWGGIHHGSNSAAAGSISSSSASTHSSQLSTEDFRAPSTPVSINKKKHRRTPGGASSGNLSINSTSTSESDSSSLAAGSFVGRCIREPLRDGGMVFGRELKRCVAETALQAAPSPSAAPDNRPQHHRTASGSKTHKGDDVTELESRRLPALVVRCTQHILTWGVQEEGLFRVTGRHGHMTKLRKAFDTGDLDPHAVASVFKAYIRELPEPILTYALMPYFDTAIAAETQNRQSFDSDRPTKAPNTLRKPPSLSTLAMPNFSNMRPPSDQFVDALKSLIAALPQENRDLLRTIIEVIKETAKHSKETKMPLSNLLLLFCPSTSMSPPLLRAFCEAEDIWDGDDHTDVTDVKRRLTIKASSLTRDDSSSSADSSLSSNDGFDDVLTDDDEGNKRNTMISDHAVTPTAKASVALDQSPVYAPARPRGGARRAPISTLYLDTASADDLSLQSFGMHDDEVKLSLADSLSSRSSTASPVSPDPSNPFSPPSLSHSMESLTSLEASSSSHLPLAARTSHNEGLSLPYNPMFGKAATLPLSPTPTQSAPNVSEFGIVQFPSSGSPPMKHRPSVPLMTMTPPTYSSSSSPPSVRTARLKKPSLHLLFTRKSSASLTGLSTASISAPVPRSPPASSGSPISPDSWRARASIASIASIASSEPPVLDLALETTPLDLKKYLAQEKRRTLNARQRQADSFYSARESLSPSDGLSPVTPIPSKRPMTPSPISQTSSTSTSGSKDTPIADFYSTPCSSVTSFHEAPPARPRARPSQASLASTSFNHLSMALPDESMIEDDWAHSVIAASETEGGWKNVLKFFG